MRFMVLLRVKSGREAAIRELLPAEVAHVEKLRQAGVVQELYVGAAGRAWVVLKADSPDDAGRILAEFPFYPHVDAEVEKLNN